MSGHNVNADLLKSRCFEPDPGDGNAIQVKRSRQHIYFVTGASGETNTLADPPREGIELMLVCLTHGGGDRVVTAASGVNVAGNTSLTFDTANGFLKLESVRDSATPTFAWRIIGSSDVTLA